MERKKKPVLIKIPEKKLSESEIKNITRLAKISKTDLTILFDILKNKFSTRKFVNIRELSQFTEIEAKKLQVISEFISQIPAKKTAQIGRPFPVTRKDKPIKSSDPDETTRPHPEILFSKNKRKNKKPKR